MAIFQKQYIKTIVPVSLEAINTIQTRLLNNRIQIFEALSSIGGTPPAVNDNIISDVFTTVNGWQNTIAQAQVIQNDGVSNKLYVEVFASSVKTIGTATQANAFAKLSADNGLDRMWTIVQYYDANLNTTIYELIEIDITNYTISRTLQLNQVTQVNPPNISLEYDPNNNCLWLARGTYVSSTTGTGYDYIIEIYKVDLQTFTITLVNSTTILTTGLQRLFGLAVLVDVNKLYILWGMELSYDLTINVSNGIVMNVFLYDVAQNTLQPVTYYRVTTDYTDTYILMNYIGVVAHLQNNKLFFIAITFSGTQKVLRFHIYDIVNNTWTTRDFILPTGIPTSRIFIKILLEDLNTTVLAAAYSFDTGINEYINRVDLYVIDSSLNINAYTVYTDSVVVNRNIDNFVSLRISPNHIYITYKYSDGQASSYLWNVSTRTAYYYPKQAILARQVHAMYKNGRSYAILHTTYGYLFVVEPSTNYMITNLIDVGRTIKSIVVFVDSPDTTNLSIDILDINNNILLSDVNIGYVDLSQFNITSFKVRFRFNKTLDNLSGNFSAEAVTIYGYGIAIDTQ